MRCTLPLPDLQILINEICKICIEYEIVPWFEHIPGKDNVISDALSRNKPHPCAKDNSYTTQVDVTAALQNAVVLCKDILIQQTFLNMQDT